MSSLSVAVPLLLLAAVGYLSAADATVINIPWGVTPATVYNIHITNPAYKPPTPTAPSPTPHPTPTTPTPTKKPPPPSPVSPPSPAVMPPPPAPVVTGRRLLAPTPKLLYPYRYLIKYTPSTKTYRYATLVVAPYTKLNFRLGRYGSKGHHGLARTSAAHRCAHPIETYLHPTSNVVSFAVTLPHKGFFHFYDPTLTPEPTYNLKHKFTGTHKEFQDCEHDFMSLTVQVK